MTSASHKLPPEFDNWPYRLTRCAAWPLTLRKKLGKFFAEPAAGIEFVMPVFGNYYKGTTGYFQDDKIVKYASHEPATLRLMRAILQAQKNAGQNTVYADIGTNTGQHLIAMLDLADEAYGFEPWEKVRNMAQSSLALNNAVHAKIFPFGLGEQDAELDYNVPANNNIGTGSFINKTKDHDSVMRLQIKHGDALFKSENIHPTLIKIDTEGFEEHVFKGLAETLRNDAPAIVFEYDGTTRKTLSMNDLHALLGDYELYGLTRSRELPQLKPFDPEHKWENVLALPTGSPIRDIILKAFLR